MNFLKTSISVLAVCAMGLTFTSCSDDDDDKLVSFLEIPSSLEYNSDNYWKECYNTSYNATGLNLGTMIASHDAQVTEWEGVKYYSWYGFCPSKAYSKADMSADWIANQWAAHATSPDGPFLLGFWDVREKFDDAVNAKACTLKLTDGSEFTPKTILMANSNYGYYAMTEGTPFNKKFGKGDYFVVRIYGMSKGQSTGYVDVYLAQDGKVVDEWTWADLTKLGKIDEMRFTVNSSDTGEWGMNTPAYFCVGSLSYKR